MADSLWDGPVGRNVVSVLFATDATPEQKAAAVWRVRGRVVGGLVTGPRGGLYTLHVEAAGRRGCLQLLLDTLRRQPGVLSATFEMRDGPAGRPAAPVRPLAAS